MCGTCLSQILCRPQRCEVQCAKRAFNRFVFGFGAAGAVTFLTAAAGLAGVACNSRALLGLYSVLMVLLLLAQARPGTPSAAPAQAPTH